MQSDPLLAGLRARSGAGLLGRRGGVARGALAMTLLAFALMAAALLSGLVVTAAWTWRTSSASLAAKIALPALMLAAALTTPWTFTAMLGRPVPTTAADLPDGAHLIAFEMLDGDTRADLWLREGASTRAYEIAVSDNERQALRKARAGLAGGDGVAIRTGQGQGKPTGMYTTGSDGFGVTIAPKEPAKSGE